MVWFLSFKGAEYLHMENGQLSIDVLLPLHHLVELRTKWGQSEGVSLNSTAHCLIICPFVIHPSYLKHTKSTSHICLVKLSTGLRNAEQPFNHISIWARTSHRDTCLCCVGYIEPQIGCYFQVSTRLWAGCICWSSKFNKIWGEDFLYIYISYFLC